MIYIYPYSFAIINLRGVSTNLNYEKYCMQVIYILSRGDREGLQGIKVEFALTSISNAMFKASGYNYVSI